METPLPIPLEIPLKFLAILVQCPVAMHIIPALFCPAINNFKANATSNMRTGVM